MFLNLLICLPGIYTVPGIILVLLCLILRPWLILLRAGRGLLPPFVGLR